MNRKILLLILLVCFTYSSSLFAVEVNLTKVSINTESSMENKIDELSIDEVDLFIETIFEFRKLVLHSSLPFDGYLNEHLLTSRLFKPPIKAISMHRL